MSWGVAPFVFDHAAAAAAAMEMSGFVSSFPPLEGGGVVLEEEERLDRAMAASRKHRDAERRRRERIKCHLDRLRCILDCDDKMDKASLLAKAVEYVRELKQRAAAIGEMENFPTEVDEVTVIPGNLPDAAAAAAGPVIKASFCCEDRSGLLPELAETLRSLRLRILRAEIATLGDRVRSIIVVAGEEEEGGGDQRPPADVGPVVFLKDALSALLDRPPASGGTAQPKRRRVLQRSAATTP